MTAGPEVVRPDDAAAGGNPHEAYLLGADLLVPYLQDNLARLREGLEGSGEVPVHRSRVACRRLRSALRGYGGSWEADESVAEAVRETSGGLRWLGRRLALARDIEVQRARLKSELRVLDAGQVHGQVWRHSRARLDSRAERARERIERTRRSGRYRGLARGLTELVESGLPGAPDCPAAEVVAEVLEAQDATITAMIGALDPAGTGRRGFDIAVHDVRKAVKVMRYATEVARPLATARVESVLGEFTAIQDLLGVHQDAVVAGQWLGWLAKKAAAQGEPTFTYGVLWQRSVEEAVLDPDELARHWWSVRAAVRSLADGW